MGWVLEDLDWAKQVIFDVSKNFFLLIAERPFLQIRGGPRRVWAKATQKLVWQLEFHIKLLRPFKTKLWWSLGKLGKEAISNSSLCTSQTVSALLTCKFNVNPSGTSIRTSHERKKLCVSRRPSIMTQPPVSLVSICSRLSDVFCLLTETSHGINAMSAQLVIPWMAQSREIVCRQNTLQ